MNFAIKFVCPVIFVWGVVFSLASAAEEKVKTVAAKDLKLQVPASWKEVKTTSQFRAAQFAIAGKDAKDEEAELVVYHFGGPTGGVNANIARWVGQFEEKGRNVKLLQGKSKQGEYYLADISGTWKKPDGPPFARKTIDKPGSRVIGVVLITGEGEKQDYYFLKLAGPDALVKSQSDALRAAIGANAKSEKAYELKGE